MSGQDLILELRQYQKKMEIALSECRKRGLEASKTERDYRVALRKQMLIERENGTPASITSDMARGVEDIADLKQARDNASVLYDSARDALQVYKLVSRLVDAQIEREWRG